MNKKPKIYVIADTHFNHKRIIELAYRPEDYQERIVKSLEVLNEGDTLIHLGDIALGQEAKVHEEVFLPLPCRKILVKGNHDGHSSNWYMNHGWDFCCRSYMDKFFGYKILFTHAPVSIPKDINLNIHGHLHAEVHRTYPFMWGLRRQHILVSLEQLGYKPVLLESLIP